MLMGRRDGCSLIEHRITNTQSFNRSNNLDSIIPHSQFNVLIESSSLLLLRSPKTSLTGSDSFYVAAHLCQRSIMFSLSTDMSESVCFPDLNASMVKYLFTFG